MSKPENNIKQLKVISHEESVSKVRPYFSEDATTLLGKLLIFMSLEVYSIRDLEVRHGLKTKKSWSVGVVKISRWGILIKSKKDTICVRQRWKQKKQASREVEGKELYPDDPIRSLVARKAYSSKREFVSQNGDKWIIHYLNRGLGAEVGIFWHRKGKEHTCYVHCEGKERWAG